MLLKANKYRKDKKADCRQNKLGSRIFMGKVFGDYAECLHFYPSFSYGRIIAGYNMSLNQEEEKYIEQLYREMYTRLCFYAKNALGSRTLAEEVVQDTFRIACIKPDSLMNSQNPHGWLINTLKNVIRNRQRTEARLSNALLVAMSVCEPQAKANVETAEFHAAYSDALGKDDFQLLINIVIRKYSMLEAAEELGISVEACKKRVQRAKKKLQKIIEKDF